MPAGTHEPPEQRSPLLQSESRVQPPVMVQLTLVPTTRPHCRTPPLVERQRSPLQSASLEHARPQKLPPSG